MIFYIEELVLKPKHLGQKFATLDDAVKTIDENREKAVKLLSEVFDRYEIQYPSFHRSRFFFHWLNILQKK